MAMLFLTVFYDPKATDSQALVERLAQLAPEIGIGVRYEDITESKEMRQRYGSIAPAGSMAGTLVFTGQIDENALRARVKRAKRR